jgi:hypothetical protein
MIRAAEESYAEGYRHGVEDQRMIARGRTPWSRDRHLIERRTGFMGCELLPWTVLEDVAYERGYADARAGKIQQPVFPR